MININHLFIAQFETILTSKNFKRKKNIFHRLHEGKIIQIFSIKKFQDRFTIQYAMIPLCAGEQIEFPLDENRIGDLVGNEVLFEWKIDDNVEESLLDAQDKCEKYLYDWFDYVKDYTTFYDFVLKHHEKKLSILSEEYKLKNATFLTVPKDVGFYEVSLYLGKYENAISALEARLEQKISAVETNKRYGIKPTKKAIIEQKEIIHQIAEIRSYQRGTSFPDEILKNKEIRTLNSYLKELG